MPPKDDDDDLPPEDDDNDDVEKAKQPLLGDGKGGKKVPSSDSALPGPSQLPPPSPRNIPPPSPRDRMRQLSASTPRTSRGEAPSEAPASVKPELDVEALAKLAEDAINDPKALLELAKHNPAAAQAIEFAQKIKEDPAAAALAAAEALKKIRPPTVEELKEQAELAKKEAEETKAAALKVYKEMMADKPPPCFPMADVSKRMERYVDLLIHAIPEGKIPPSVEPLKPKILLAIQIGSTSAGYLFWIGRWIYKIWCLLPFNVTQMLFGISLCYFGGTFTTSIAAMEAFRTMGGEKAKRDFDALIAELRPAFEANAKDDDEDLDGDGVADVDQLTPPQLMQRKVLLLVTTVRQPEKIQEAVGSIYAAFLAVIATLKLEFAATTAMAMGVADMVKKPLIKVLEPPLLKALPENTHQWVRPTIDSSFRIAAIIFAWYVQQIISAFYSALRGGKLFAEGLFNIIAEKAKKGLILCPGLVGPDWDPNDSYMDEIIAWILAFQGFMFQINTGFKLQFPFNIIFLPLTILEWYLRFQISSDVMTDGGSGRRLLDEHSMCAEAEACCVAAGWTNVTQDVYVRELR